MGKRGQDKELFTASEVARFCQVDLKTIHNWADRGEVRHFRTPGRHLRFRRLDVLDFLRKYGYPIPEMLSQGRSTVHIVDEDRNSLAMLSAELSPRFEVTAFSEPVDALIAVGSACPDVVVLDITGAKLDVVSCIERLKHMDSTRHVRVIVYSNDESAQGRALAAGASGYVRKPQVKRLIEMIDALMGTTAS
jgi:excisionase family DNA binding protein